MSRIRVDTDELKTKAGAFESAAGVIARAGDEALAAAMALPSYAGQLAGPARAAGYEIQRRSRQLGGGLQSDAQALQAAARAYEEVDIRTVDGIASEWSLLISSSGSQGSNLSTPIKTGGRPDIIGYEDYGDYVVLWKNGEAVTVYRTDANRSMIFQFTKDVDDFCRYAAEVIGIIQEMVMQSLSLLPSLILFVALQGGGMVNYLKLKFPEINGILAYADKLMGLIGLSATDWIEKLGVDIPSFDITEYGDETKELLQTLELANAAHADAVKIWEALQNATP